MQKTTKFIFGIFILLLASLVIAQTAQQAQFDLTTLTDVGKLNELSTKDLSSVLNTDGGIEKLKSFEWKDIKPELQEQILTEKTFDFKNELQDYVKTKISAGTTIGGFDRLTNKNIAYDKESGLISITVSGSTKPSILDPKSLQNLPQNTVIIATDEGFKYVSGDKEMDIKQGTLVRDNNQWKLKESGTIFNLGDSSGVFEIDKEGIIHPREGDIFFKTLNEEQVKYTAKANALIKEGSGFDELSNVKVELNGANLNIPAEKTNLYVNQAPSKENPQYVSVDTKDSKIKYGGKETELEQTSDRFKNILFDKNAQNLVYKNGGFVESITGDKIKVISQGENPTYKNVDFFKNAGADSDGQKAASIDAGGNFILAAKRAAVCKGDLRLCGYFEQGGGPVTIAKVSAFVSSETEDSLKNQMNSGELYAKLGDKNKWGQLTALEDNLNSKIVDLDEQEYYQSVGKGDPKKLQKAQNAYDLAKQNYDNFRQSFPSQENLDNLRSYVDKIETINSVLGSDPTKDYGLINRAPISMLYENTFERTIRDNTDLPEAERTQLYQGLNKVIEAAKAADKSGTNTFTKQAQMIITRTGDGGGIFTVTGSDGKELYQQKLSPEYTNAYWKSIVNGRPAGTVRILTNKL